MPNVEPLQRLQAALVAQSAEHWWPVLSQLIANGDSWHRFHFAVDKPDPAIEEMLDLVESDELDSNARFALALAKLELTRRRAVIGPGHIWTVFDGPFAQILELAPAVEIRTDHDTRTPTQRIAHTLLGWALFDLRK